MMIERQLARAEKADAAGQHAAAVAADQLASKLASLLVDRVDQTVRQAVTDELKPDLSNLRQKAAQVRHDIATHTGPQSDVEGPKHVTH
jgi:hypothetical protein